MAIGRIPVTVVAGGSRSGKSRLIAQLRAGCPPGERWAYLGNSGVQEVQAQPGSGQSIPADQHFGVAGGCACCLAGPVFRTTLVRLLRAGPWQRLHIEVDPGGHPHRLTDQLRLPPFDQYLRVTDLLLTVRWGGLPGDRLPGDRLPGDRLPPPESLHWAGKFLLCPGPEPRGDDALAARLQSAPPWPRLERRGDPRWRQAGPGQGVGPGQGPGQGQAQAQGVAPMLPHWRVFSMLQPDETAEGPDHVRHWPAEEVFERRPFRQLLTALAGEPGVAGLQALIRTPRAWYRWRFGRGRGPGAFAFDEGRQIVETETAWRLDSRICLWLAPGADHDAVLARLQGLGLAVQDSEGATGRSAG